MNPRQSLYIPPFLIAAKMTTAWRGHEDAFGLCREVTKILCVHYTGHKGIFWSGSDIFQSDTLDASQQGIACHEGILIVRNAVRWNPM